MSTAAARGTTVVSDRAVRRIVERAAAEAAGGGPGALAKGAARVNGRHAAVAVEVDLPARVPL
ncbi:DEAD/DEAH box helicase, partial [Streptomyces sp. SID5785]|nr:DEAD/DEAH box helicase [Streptomyces sp. SID5785]